MPQFFEKISSASKATNKFLLEVPGAGGAFWAIFYAIPTTVSSSVCRNTGNETSCSLTNSSLYLTAAVLGSMIFTANAFRNYLLSPEHRNIPLEPMAHLVMEAP
jgi:hypothetical protein